MRGIFITEDKIILITGSTDGIGYQTAIELVKSGFHVIVHGRNREKAELTVKRIEKIIKRIIYFNSKTINNKTVN